MEITHKIINNIYVINVDGEIDAYNIYKLKNFLRKSCEKGIKKYIINLTKIHFMDSTAFGTLIIENNYLREENGGIKLINISKKLQTTIELMGLEDILEYYENEEAAISSFGRI